MYKSLAILLFVSLTCAAIGEPNIPAKNTFPDGVILAGVDGTLSKTTDPNNYHLFTFKTTIANDRGSIQEGQAVEILESSTLEKMQSVMKDPNSDFRIWGHVTKFEGKNFIFPVYYLSIVEAKRQDANFPSIQKPISINEANDVVKIPKEVLERLTPKHTVELTQLSPTAGLEEDRMFSDRSGFVIKENNGAYIFKPDGLGRNVGKISFAVLPNNVLQHAIFEQTHEPDRVRFKVTGILTMYQNKNYILLQRAARQFSQGNFAR